MNIRSVILARTPGTAEVLEMQEHFPLKGDIQISLILLMCVYWTPAFAGVTKTFRMASS